MSLFFATRLSLLKVILLMCINFIVFAVKTRSLVWVSVWLFLSKSTQYSYTTIISTSRNLFQFHDILITRVKSDTLQKIMIRERIRVPLQLPRCYYHLYLFSFTSKVTIKYTFQGCKKPLQKLLSHDLIFAFLPINTFLSYDIFEEKVYRKSNLYVSFQQWKIYL